mmetsp:Transcript_39519/g.95967  ORF Transcript_39519/g.95967 Transcript_39519/m.95967 type:complete len:208 (-) Transcript_39519:1471-2094(-)
MVTGSMVVAYKPISTEVETAEMKPWRSKLGSSMSEVTSPRAREKPSMTMLVSARKGPMSCTTVSTMCTSEPNLRKPRKEKQVRMLFNRMATAERPCTISVVSQESDSVVLVLTSTSAPFCERPYRMSPLVTMGTSATAEVSSPMARSDSSNCLREMAFLNACHAVGTSRHRAMRVVQSQPMHVSAKKEPKSLKSSAKSDEAWFVAVM